MNKRVVKDIISANDFIVIHPALDFFGTKAIISVGDKRAIIYEDDGDYDLVTRPFCILSNGDSFDYSRKELVERGLFHTGQLEIPPNRWSIKDIKEYIKDPGSLEFTEVFKLVRERIQHYMDFSDKRVYSLLTCFIIYTYFYPIFNFAPILQLWGEFRTGKTKICSLIDSMCFNPVNSSNISAASLFRLIENRRAIVILDESEDLLGSERCRDIRNMLLAGTGKSGETYRQEKSLNDKYVTQAYRVFSPKVIANIAGVDVAALESRIIQVTTSSSINPLKLNRDVTAEDKTWIEIRNQLYRLCLYRPDEVIEMQAKLPKHELSGRSFKIWEGILTIASLSGSDIWEEVLDYAKENKTNMESEMVDFGSDSTDFASRLLELCGDSDKPIKVSATELLSKLIDLSVESTKELAIKMGRFGLKSKQFRVGNKVGRYYIFDKEKIQKYVKVIDLTTVPGLDNEVVNETTVEEEISNSNKINEEVNNDDR